MSTILDKKSEVLSVELTKYGRQKLGEGFFEPAFYLFYDDTVIYDDKYTGNTLEEINEIQDKILYNSINTRFCNLINSQEKIIDNLAPIGKTDPDSVYAPAWELNMLYGTIKEVVEASSSYYKKDIILDSITSSAVIEQTNLSQYGAGNNSIFEFEGGKVLKFDTGYILMEIIEENVDNNSKNFDIEIFTYNKLYGGKEKGLKQKLNFLQQPSNIIDGIIYDTNELPQAFFEQEPTPDDVSYYLDVLVDDEIDQNFILRREQPLQDLLKPTYSPTIIDAPKDIC